MKKQKCLLGLIQDRRGFCINLANIFVYLFTVILPLLVSSSTSCMVGKYEEKLMGSFNNLKSAMATVSDFLSICFNISLISLFYNQK